MSKHTRRNGIVQAFNVSPKGLYEGLLLEHDGELTQINFPQEWSATVAGAIAPGDSIEAEVEPLEHNGHASHPVYRLLTLGGGKEKLSLDHMLASDGARISGTVQRLNYALHGEVNGAVLDSGDFLHLKPHGAAALQLKVGMKVSGTGRFRLMPGGHRVIEASEVNGVAIDKKPRPKKKPH